MSRQPTPGPWEVHKGGFGRHDHIRDTKGSLIADDVFPEANAHLIAAAPELLEVARTIRDCRPEYETAEENQRLVQRLADVIAKAEGRE